MFQTECSVRFCVSASHTKDDLDRLLRACDEVGDILQLKFSSGIAGETVAASNSNKSDALSDSETLCEDTIPSFSPPPKEQSLTGAFKKPRWDIEDVIRQGVIDTRA
jgi:serine palmitoyltransferase